MYKTHKDSLPAFKFNLPIENCRLHASQKLVRNEYFNQTTFTRLAEVYVPKVINISTVNIIMILGPFNSSCAYSASDSISLCSVYSCLFITLSNVL